MSKDGRLELIDRAVKRLNDPNIDLKERIKLLRVIASTADAIADELAVSWGLDNLTK